MSINWDSLNTFADWAAALDRLLDKASESILSGEVATRVEAQKELNRFITRSPNAIAGELDEIAREAINDIFRTAMDEALAGIASRTAALARLSKTVKAVSEEANAGAKSIRLARATTVIESATRTIRDLHDLRAALSESEDDTILAGRIDKAVGSIQDLVPAVMAVRPAE
ncbi:hypothetical protein ACUUL3_10355 [Thiovibrio sp. JS02]